MTREPGPSCDIAIIGGGMVGASLASLLAVAQPDWRILLIEALPLPEPGGATYQPSFDARSSALSEGSAQLLRQLGLWETLQEHVTAISAVHVSDRGHLGGSLLHAREYGLPAVGYVVENAWLGQVLLGHVRRQPNIECLAPARVERLEPVRGGYRLHLAADAAPRHCRLAVIADGGDSPLRRALGIQVRVSDYDQLAVIANVAFTQAHGGVAYERFTPEGPLALLPLGESPAARRSALVWTLPKAEAETVLALPEAEFLQALQRVFGDRLGRFERAGLRHSYPLKLLEASEQVRSHLVLAGNAAHFLHPVAGQGFNLSLRDCGALAETLITAERQGEALGQLSVLERYLAQRQRDQALTTAFSDQLVRRFSSVRLPDIALRHLGLLGLELAPALKQGFATTAMGRGGRRADWRPRSAP